MKTTSRLSCQLVRRWISIFSEPGQPSGMGARHVSDCPECQRFFAANDALASVLKREAAQFVEPVPAGMDRAIMQAIVDSKAKHAVPNERRPLNLLFAGSGIGIATIIAVVALRHDLNTGAPRPLPTVGPAITAGPVTAADAPAITSWQALAEPVAAVLEEDPLQTEAESVYADARGALRFLAANFLPTAPASQPGDATTLRSQRRADG